MSVLVNSAGFRNPMTTGGDIIYGGANGIPLRLANGTSGYVLTSAGGTSAPSWQLASAVPSFAYRSVSSTDTATTSDYSLGLSGASFTETLYSTSGNNGKIIVLTHLGTSLSQVYTLASGSDTIGGVSSGNFKLFTNGESVTLQADATNSNWVILNHKTNTPRVAYTPTFGAGFGTVSNAAGFWWRTGDELFAQVACTCGTVAASAGSISLPTGASIDSNKLTSTSNTIGNIGTKVGTWGGNTSNGLGNIITAAGSSLTVVYISSNVATGTQLITATSAVSTFALGSSSPFAAEFKVPIANWQA